MTTKIGPINYTSTQLMEDLNVVQIGTRTLQTTEKDLQVPSKRNQKTKPGPLPKPKEKGKTIPKQT